MPTTVKSLEERLDEFSADVLGRLDSLESAIEGLSSNSNALTTTVGASIKKSDDMNNKVESLRIEFAEFRGKVDATLGLVKWVGASAAVAAVTVIIASFSVARSAGSLETTVQNQQKTLDEISKHIHESKK